jgi:hypothetical protein
MKTITATINGKSVELEVIEHVTCEPSAYQWEAGWVCADDETEYFVSESGDVWLQPENTNVGHAPAIKRECDRRERELDAASHG